MGAVKKAIKNALWRRKNKPNFTAVGNEGFPLDIVEVGLGTYGTLNVVAFGSANEHLTIGNYCSIADRVVFLLGGNHDYEAISTYPFYAKYRNGVEALSKGPIVVDDDVWLGYGATILSGVHIGKGAVVASCSLVCQDVEPYSIVGGIPARRIKYRFEKDSRQFAQRIDYEKLDLNNDETLRLLAMTPKDAMSLEVDDFSSVLRIESAEAN